jgi:valine dehydrogenase (NAD+)
VAALTATVVCGGANNQLAHPGIEQRLADRGITYAPDYLVNAGGVIQVADEWQGFQPERAEAAARGIFDTTTRVLALAAARSITPLAAADELVRGRIAAVSRLGTIWNPTR